MAKILVRTAEVDDAVAMGSVHVDAWQAAYADIMPPSFLDALDPKERASQWRSVIESNPSPTEGRRLVVELDGDVVGIALVWASRDEDTSELGELILINLTPRAWGTGAAVTLLAECESSLRSCGYGEAILWVAAANARARRFYERQGWRCDDVTREDVVDGAEVSEIRYRRSLPTT